MAELLDYLYQVAREHFVGDSIEQLLKVGSIKENSVWKFFDHISCNLAWM
jgi:hypothetical protein